MKKRNGNAFDSLAATLLIVIEAYWKAFVVASLCSLTEYTFLSFFFLSFSKPIESDDGDRSWIEIVTKRIVVNGLTGRGFVSPNISNMAGLVRPTYLRFVKLCDRVLDIFFQLFSS